MGTMLRDLSKHPFFDFFFKGANKASKVRMRFLNYQNYREGIIEDNSDQWQEIIWNLQTLPGSLFFDWSKVTSFHIEFQKEGTYRFGGFRFLGCPFFPFSFNIGDSKDLSVSFALPAPFCQKLSLFSKSGYTAYLTLAPCYVSGTIWNDKETLVYKDYGVNYFSNFTHTVDFQLTQSAWNGDYSRFIFWMLSNELDGWVDLRTGNKTAVGLMFNTPGGIHRFTLMEAYNGTEYSSHADLSYHEFYYLKIEKIGTNLTCEVYSDEDRTDLLATITLTLHGNWSFRYLHVVQSYIGIYGASTGAIVSKVNLFYSGLNCICPT